MPVGLWTPPVSHERLRDLLFYDPHTGLFVWRKNRGRKVRAWTRAGSIGRDGTVWVTVDQRAYPAHRLAYYWVTGRYPQMIIGFKNKDRGDLRWSNLEGVDHDIEAPEVRNRELLTVDD